MKAEKFSDLWTNYYRHADGRIHALSLGTCERCGATVQEANSITVCETPEKLEALGLQEIDYYPSEIVPQDDGSYGCYNCPSDEPEKKDDSTDWLDEAGKARIDLLVDRIAKRQKVRDLDREMADDLRQHFSGTTGSTLRVTVARLDEAVIAADYEISALSRRLDDLRLADLGRREEETYDPVTGSNKIETTFNAPEYGPDSGIDEDEKVDWLCFYERPGFGRYATSWIVELTDGTEEIVGSPNLTKDEVVAILDGCFALGCRTRFEEKPSS